METFLLGILIVLVGVQIGFQIATARLLVRMQESDVARIRRFLENRGLIDIPMAREGQRDYTNSDVPRSPSTGLRIMRDE